MKHSIIGCGRVAPNHVIGFKNCGIKVKWCCDLNLQRAKRFSEKYDIPNYTSDYNEILKDESITSVSVCTDHASHSKIAIDSLNFAKHVLVEKPMAINAKEARLMIEKANSTRKLLSVIYQNRFSKLIRKIKQDIDNELFGEITMVKAHLQCSKEAEYYKNSNWRGTLKKEGGSTLINQGIHTLDLLLWIMGKPIYVVGIKSNIKFRDLIDTEDSLAALLKFSNGAIGSFSSTNTSTVGWESYIEVVGTKGRICFTTCHPFKILKLDIQSEVKTHQYREEADRITSSDSGEDLLFPSEIYYGVTHYYQIINFINAINGREELEIPGEEGYKTTEVIDAIYQTK